MENNKQYNLTQTEDNGESVTTTTTTTEHASEILRMMKLAGIESAHVHGHDESIEEEVEAEVYEPTEANDKLDLDDYSKKSPESISKQKKSIQPTLGDNPLEYSLDENEIYEAMMTEFNAMQEVNEEEEDVNEAQSPAQKAAFAKMLAAKKGKKDDTVEETTDELKEETISEDCGCGHGSDCDCGPECDCGCNAVNETTENNMSEEQARIRELAGIDSQSINEDESVWNQFLKLNDEMDFESEDRIFFSLKHWPKHRFELHGDIDGKDTKSGGVHLGVLVSREDGDDDNFAGNMSMPQDEIKANITGAAWVGTDSDIKGTAGDYKEFSDVFPEPYDDKEPEDQHKNIHAFSKDASGEYHNKDEDEEVNEEKLDEILPVIAAAGSGLAKAIKNKFSKPSAPSEPASTSKEYDIMQKGMDYPVNKKIGKDVSVSNTTASTKAAGQGPASTKFKKFSHDSGVKAPKAGQHDNSASRWAESTETKANLDRLKKLSGL